MPRPLASRRARLPPATGAALSFTLAVPAPAWPATVDVTYTWLSSRAVGQVRMSDPQDGHCYTVHELTSNALRGTFGWVHNDTDKAVFLYS